MIYKKKYTFSQLKLHQDVLDGKHSYVKCLKFHLSPT